MQTSKLGLSEGRLLSFLYVEIRGMIVYAYEGRMAEMTALMELLLKCTACVHRLRKTVESQIISR